MKYYVVKCVFHKSYVAENEEQVRELMDNDPSIPDIHFKSEISDCSDVDDDWSIGPSYGTHHEIYQIDIALDLYLLYY